MNREAKKSVLITGCTPGGIGHALCLEYHRRGLFVIATARRPEVLEPLANTDGITTMGLDVTNEVSIKACHDEVAKLTGGKLDILVNNAGRVHTFPATDLDIPDVIETFQSNVFGTMAMVKGFIDLLIPARGLIINSASASAVSAYAFASAYAASKGAVVSYSRALRLELLPFGVRVMCAMSGVVQSNISSHGTRVLPEESIYQPARDIFEWRLDFSQAHPASQPTERFARDFVSASLRPECPAALPFLRGWVGRPDWYWSGGTASIVHWTHTLGEWLNDVLLYGAMRIGEIKRIVEREAAMKKTR
ncbi:NAD(P)-binding protein [Xylariomycetidae sp. FL2044]|nr:NAD(P)-binding protein [Xylariomycetidae sp. FL2044]